MVWYLNRALTNWRAAVNAAYPGRDKTSDGTIGDEAHQATNSDHNPDPDGSVDAWDMDVNLRSANDAAAIENLKRIFQGHESSRYWIHNGQVASRSTGWQRQTYTGPNPHDKHVHWNTREAYEDSAAPWPLPPAPTGDTMLAFVKSTDPALPQVYLGDGIIRRPVDEQDINDIRFLAREGWLGPLANSGAIRAAANLDAFGVLPAVPEAVVSEAQVDRIAAALIAADTNPLSDADRPVIVAAVKQALREGAA